MHNKFMSEALLEALKAEKKGEVPVGAVLVRNGEIIARAHNLCESEKNPMLHAEMLVIDKALKLLNCSRLDDCDLYVTLEPCAMCCGAICHARINRLYFGAYDKIAGAVVSVHNLLDDKHSFKTEYYCGIMEDKCSSILTEFFRKLR